MSLSTIDGVRVAQFSKEFPADSGIETITNATGYTTFREMQITLPEGAVLVKAYLFALMHAINMGTNGFTINTSLYLRKNTGGPTAIFAASNSFSVPATQYNITSWSGIFDVTNHVDDLSAKYSARFSLTGQGTTNDIRVTTGYILVVYYRLE